MDNKKTISKTDPTKAYLMAFDNMMPHITPLKSKDHEITVGISAHHIHVTQVHLDELFGKGYKLTKYKALSQPGQFAAKETLTVVGPKGVLEKVRILGPVRKESQVEISATDGYHLGLEPPVRDSADLDGTPGISLVGPNRAITLDKGVILAATHIHMSPDDAKKLGLKDRDRVQVLVDGERNLIFNHVLIRVSEDFESELHIDTDEANAAVIENGDKVQIIGKEVFM